MELLQNLYPWIKAAHILSVISWMAALLYLPRLFVNHVEQTQRGSDADQLLQMMEKKLLKVIMGPAMMATWIFGILLVSIPGLIDWASIWPWVKFTCVISMTVFHIWLSNQRKKIANGTQVHSGRTYRLLNEVPTVLMILIVVMVIVRPF